MASSISKAYEALSIYDYFKAKQLFYKSIKKQPAFAAYGLATIYSRNDNPFSNYDSAAKYIYVASTQFKDTAIFSTFYISSGSIAQLAYYINNRAFQKYVEQGNTHSISHFLSTFLLATDSIKQVCFDKRDQLELSRLINYQKSDSIQVFLSKYPESVLYSKAQKLFFDFEYNEQTNEKTREQYQRFLIHFKSNPNVFYAERNLLELTRQLYSSDSLYRFIQRFSTQTTQLEAWKLLYSSSMKTYSKQELTRFIKLYPEYPLTQDVLKEINLSDIKLIPVKNSLEKFGYIDTLGNWKILPQFDDALNFTEGIASVCRNDSCFYINKEGIQIFNQTFDEAENYSNGVAIVKRKSKYYLINRSGQVISDAFEDMITSIGKYFICKKQDMYGVINAKGEIVIPFKYNKLGNFENGYAYYLKKQYGLINTDNKVLQAQWDWISNVDENALSVVKRDNFFGLMNLNEELLLPTKFDFITPCMNGIYLVVKDNLYGFFNAIEKCFITSITYNYNNANPVSYYTNGTLFKLLQGDKVALIDANGKQSIPFGQYQDVYFAKSNIIRVQKNSKYGFVDRKLKPITSMDYEDATDFNFNTVITYKKSTVFLIDNEGEIVFSLKEGKIENEFNTSVYRLTDKGLNGLITYSGDILLNAEFKEITALSSTLYLCYKDGGNVYLYNISTKKLKKL